MKEKIRNWSAGVKKTLHLGGWDEKKKLLREVVGQRFSKCRKSSNVDDSKLMKTESLNHLLNIY
jgi:hypothetical protein